MARTEKDILGSIEDNSYSSKESMKTIRNYVAAAFWIAIASGLIIALVQFR